MGYRKALYDSILGRIKPLLWYLIILWYLSIYHVISCCYPHDRSDDYTSIIIYPLRYWLLYHELTIPMIHDLYWLEEYPMEALWSDPCGQCFKVFYIFLKSLWRIWIGYDRLVEHPNHFNCFAKVSLCALDITWCWPFEDEFPRGSRGRSK